MDSQKRVAIVTGASKGIGAAIAMRLAQDGIAVVVNYARGRAAADAVVASITAAGGSAVAAGADIGSAEGIGLLFDVAEKTFGSVDILVNNAGVMALSPLAEATDVQFETMMAVNLGGVFRGLREGGRRIAKGGRIISFSSSVVGSYPATYGLYAATKAAVEAMTHVMAKEMGPRGITVNVVAPGPVETELFLTGKSEAQVKGMMAANPFGRLGQPDDIAGVVSFLAGPDSGWVSGQVIRANGAMI